MNFYVKKKTAQTKKMAQKVWIFVVVFMNFCGMVYEFL